MYTFIAGVMFGIAIVMYLAKGSAQNSIERSFGKK